MNSIERQCEKALQWSKTIFRNLFLILIEIYRLLLAPHFGGACRFEPSCSIYAQKAFSDLPLGLAIRLTLKRLSKCRPGGEFGIDPVPHLDECSCSHRSQ